MKLVFIQSRPERRIQVCVLYSAGVVYTISYITAYISSKLIKVVFCFQRWLHLSPRSPSIPRCIEGKMLENAQLACLVVWSKLTSLWLSPGMVLLQEKNYRLLRLPQHCCKLFVLVWIHTFNSPWSRFHCLLFSWALTATTTTFAVAILALLFVSPTQWSSPHRAVQKAPTTRRSPLSRWNQMWPHQEERKTQMTKNQSLTSTSSPHLNPRRPYAGPGCTIGFKHSLKNIFEQYHTVIFAVNT